MEGITAGEVISLVDDLHPNSYEETKKEQWLRVADALVYESVIKPHLGWEEWMKPEEKNYSNPKTALYAPRMYADIYRWYLEAQMDLSNREIEHYNNDIMLYNTVFEEFENWYRRNHMPLGAEEFIL